MSGNGKGIKGQLWLAVTWPKPDKTTLNFEDFLVWSKTIMRRELNTIAKLYPNQSLSNIAKVNQAELGHHFLFSTRPSSHPENYLRQNLDYPNLAHS